VLRDDGDEAVIEVVREMLAEHGENLTAPKVREALQSAATGKNGWRTPKPDGDEWFTPAKYVEAARGVLGGIDLDPASKALAQETVQAARYYSLIERGEDGLALPWAGRMFLNPPFSKAKLFGPKLLREYEAGNVQAAVMLINAYSADTKWFRPFWNHPICITDHYVKFYNPSKKGKNSGATWPRP
jgi:hypothetical protein